MAALKNSFFEGLFGPSATAALLSALEAAINSALRYDPGTLSRINAMQGKVIDVQLDTPALNLYLVILESQGKALVQLQQYFESESDLTLKGGPASIWHVLTSNDANPLLGSGLEVRGEVGLLQQLSDIAKHLDIDWEAPLVNTLGPVIGHQVAKLVKIKLDWLEHAAKRAPQVAKDFMKEESEIFAHPEAVKAFYKAVRDTKMDTERLEARITRLSQHISSGKTS